MALGHRYFSSFLNRDKTAKALRALTLLGTLASLSFSSYAHHKTESEFWSELKNYGVEDFLRRGYLAPESCQQSLPHLMGCIEAVDTLSRQAKPSMVFGLVELAHSGHLPAAGQQIRNFGPFALFKRDSGGATVAGAELSPMQAQAERRQRELERTQTTQALFNDPSRLSHLDFEQIFRQVLSEAQLQPAAIPEAMSLVTAAFRRKAYQDPHTRVVLREAFVHSRETANEGFAGIGAILNFGGEEVTVQDLVEGGPAEAAGLQGGDVIVEINGEPTPPALNEVVALLRGPEGTAVTILVRRGGEVFELSLVRAQINTPNVEVDYYLVNQMPFLYIRLRSFMDGEACYRMALALAQAEVVGALGYILDLRANGGGLLNQGICISGLFLEDGLVVVSQHDLVEEKITHFTAGIEYQTQLPGVVLIDEMSGSASEIVAGALQDYGRAWILGERSFGKGSVQGGVQYEGHDELLLFQTIARFHLPSGRTNQGVGIVPDFEVPRREGMTEEERFMPREADIYVDSVFVTQEMQGWFQPRVEEIAVLEECRQQEVPKIPEIYPSEVSRGRKLRNDHQLASGLALLACIH